MTTRLSITCIFILFLSLGCPREGNPYIRIRDGQCQVAIKSFKPNGAKPRVTLLGIVHIGEQAYYQQVQKRLDRADLVLFERVGIPSEKEEMKKKCPQHLSKGGGHQDAARRLNLVCQKGSIKKRPYFVHADVSMTTFLDLKNVIPGKPLCERVEKDRKVSCSGDHAHTVDANTLRNSLALDLVKSLSHERQHASEEEIIILFKRNEVAVERLKLELPKYHAGQEVVILYGGAHMPDLEASLYDMEYNLDSTEWLSAFSL